LHLIGPYILEVFGTWINNKQQTKTSNQLWIFSSLLTARNDKQISSVEFCSDKNDSFRVMHQLLPPIFYTFLDISRPKPLLRIISCCLGLKSLGWLKPVKQ
jgi:hypothetical protein